jgi:asparagine synthase (glutamine-hydrolysing)
VSGFAGIWDPGGPPLEPETLERLWKPISYRGPDGTSTWIGRTGGVVAGVLRVTPESSTERQPHLSTGGHVIVFDGRLDDRETLIRQLGRAIEPSAPDPVLIGAAYERWGEGFARRLRGDYATVVLDPDRGLLLARDVVGTRPLYLAELSTGGVAFASEIKALAEVPGVSLAPNDAVLAEFLLGGNARTTLFDSFFAGVRSVPPGVTIRASGSGVRWDTHDELDPDARVRFRSYGDYVEAYREHFQRAVDRRLRASTPIGLLVSGGLDSSSIWAVAADRLRVSEPSAGLVPITYTFEAGSPGDERRFVRALEDRLSTTVDEVPMSHADLLARAEEQTFVLEQPVLNEAWAAQEAVWDLLRDTGSKVYLSGLWGDQVLVEQSYLVDLVNRGRFATVRRHISEMELWPGDVDAERVRRNILGEVVRWHLPRALVPIARRARTRAGGLRHDAPWYSDHLRELALRPPSRAFVGGWSRSGVHGRSVFGRLRSPYNVAGFLLEAKSSAWAGFDHWMPFLDRDLIRFVMAIPGEVMSSGGRPRGLHRDAMAGALPDEIRLRRTKADGTSLSNRSLQEQASGIQGWFQRGILSASISLTDREILADAVLSALDRLKGENGFEAGLALLDIIALEAWVRGFFSSDASETMRSG